MLVAMATLVKIRTRIKNSDRRKPLGRQKRHLPRNGPSLGFRQSHGGPLELSGGLTVLSLSRRDAGNNLDFEVEAGQPVHPDGCPVGVGLAVEMTVFHRQ